MEKKINMAHKIWNQCTILHRGWRHFFFYSLSKFAVQNGGFFYFSVTQYTEIGKQI